MTEATGRPRSTLRACGGTRPLFEVDGRGRTARNGYDNFGNVIERRVQTVGLAAVGASPATEQVVDSAGVPVSETVQKWSYDTAFSRTICEMDAEAKPSFRKFKQPEWLILLKP